MLDFSENSSVSRFGLLHFRDEVGIKARGHRGNLPSFGLSSPLSAKYLVERHRNPGGAPEPPKIGKVKLSLSMPYESASLLGNHALALAVAFFEVLQGTIPGISDKPPS